MGCLFRRANGIYYGIFAVHGKRVWRSTLTADEQEAKKIYEVMKGEYTSWDGLTLSGFQLQLAKLIEGMLAPSTICLYSMVFRKFIEVVGDRLLTSVSPYHIELYLAKRSKEVSMTKVAIDYRMLRAAFNRAVKYRMIDSSPFNSCRNVRVPEKTPAFLSKGDFDRLLCVIPDAQFRSLVIFAVCTAMRLGEVVNLRWEDIDSHAGVIRLESREDFVLKGRRNRNVPLNEQARSILKTTVHGSPYVFTSSRGSHFSTKWVSRRFKLFSRKAGMPEAIHFHSLRHTGASWLVQKSVPLSYVKEILGHSSITTTMCYAHSTPEHLRASVRRIDEILRN